MPPTMFCGEVQSCLIHLINTSSTHSINRVRLGTSQPNLITTSPSEDESFLRYTNENEAQWTHPLNQQSSALTLVNHHHPLPANSTRTIRLWFRAAHSAGEMNVDFLFLYESDNFQQPLRFAFVIEYRRLNQSIVLDIALLNIQHCLFLPIRLDFILNHNQLDLVN